MRKPKHEIIEDDLPAPLKEVLIRWDAVDKIICFVLKRKMSCTVSTITSIFSSLHSGQSLRVEELAQFACMCPNMCVLRSLSSDAWVAQSHNLEFAFHRTCDSPGRTHTSKRRKLLLDALLNLTQARSASGVGLNDASAGTMSATALLPPLSDELAGLCEQYNTWRQSAEPTSSKDAQSNSSSQTSLLGASSSADDAAQPVTGTPPDPVRITDIDAVEEMLERLRSEAFYRDQLVHVERIAGRAAVFAELAPPALPPLLQQRLIDATGVRQLYQHQARAIDALRQGRHAVVSTSTASGKSIIYNVPVLEAVLQEPAATALYLFPTKALAQDQLRSLLAITGDGAHLPVSCAVCDGDTNQCDRARIMYPAEVGAVNVILTNPDMLHCTLLPEHRVWRRVFENIRFVVIDEAHQYRGAFGAHVACVLRRLLRVCLFYGRRPQFLCCSATIANPAEHMMKLVPLSAMYPNSSAAQDEATVKPEEDGLSAEKEKSQFRYLAVIGPDQDGSPHGDRMFALWNPPLRQGGPKQGGDKVAPGLIHAVKAETSDHPSALPAEDAFEEAGEEEPLAWCSQVLVDGRSLKQAAVPVQEEGPRLDDDDETVMADAEEGESRPQTPPPTLPTALASGATAGPTADDDPDFTPKKVRFLKGCNDIRPATMGAARSLLVHDPLLGRGVPAGELSTGDKDAGRKRHYSTPALPTNPDYEVKYVGGWKRGRAAGAERFSTRAKSWSEDMAKDAAQLARSGIEALQVMEERRVSTIWETACLFSALVRQHMRTLAFCRTRKLVELVLGYSLRDLDSHNASHLRSSVVSYRGGYTKEERRAIESDIFNGHMLGVTATCALELGIDVGALDATLHMGFPGTFASLWQQAGRAGRSGRPSLSVVICFDSPIDQYFIRNPDMLFHSAVEPAVLEVGNVHILYSHLLCAAAEVPLNYAFQFPLGSGHVPSNSSSSSSSSRTEETRSGIDDHAIWGERYTELVQYLCETRMVSPVQSDGSSRGHGHSASSSSDPAVLYRTALKLSPGTNRRASEVSLRQIDPVTIRVLDDSRGGVEIDSLGYSRAFFELFEGAIYMHRAVQYLVTSLDLPGAVAHCRPVKVKYYTSARNNEVINVTKVAEHDGVCSSGTVQVVSTVYGYVKRWLGSGEVFDKGDCSLPPLEFETSAFWIDLPLRIKVQLEAAGLNAIACIHAANHAILAMTPLYAQCDITDVDTEHSIADSAISKPFRIMIYDTRSGGLGASNAVYHSRREVLSRALELVSGCDCTAAAGCPCCTLSARCTYYNNDLSRRGALALLQLLLKHFDTHHSSAPGGFLPSSSVGAVTASPSAPRKRTTPAGPGSTISAKPPSSAAGTDPSPRKARRKKQLSAAAYRDRVRQMAIQWSWAESVPSYYQDSDLHG